MEKFILTTPDKHIVINEPIDHYNSFSGGYQQILQTKDYIFAGVIPFNSNCLSTLFISKPHTSFFRSKSSECNTTKLILLDSETQNCKDVFKTNYLNMQKNYISKCKQVTITQDKIFRFDNDISPLDIFITLQQSNYGSPSFYFTDPIKDDQYWMGSNPNIYFKKQCQNIYVNTILRSISKYDSLGKVVQRAEAEKILYSENTLKEKCILNEAISEKLNSLGTVQTKNNIKLIDVGHVWNLCIPITCHLPSPYTDLDDIINTLKSNTMTNLESIYPTYEKTIHSETVSEFNGGLVGWVDSNNDAEFLITNQLLNYDSGTNKLLIRSSLNITPESDYLSSQHKLEQLFSTAESKLQHISH
ncbi:chorismate-binding protein [Microbacterium foliorum]|uniref:chorismate-binding protein n=1 Tax=Rothia terrae TaxID=396015 RepID=UPI00342F33AA